MANGKVEQIDLFESSEATSHGSPQAEECPPQIVEWFAPVPEEQEGFWLTKERLFSEIESCDTVCPMRENDGLHLVAQEMEAADFVPKNTTEQVIRFDEDDNLFRCGVSLENAVGNARVFINATDDHVSCVYVLPQSAPESSRSAVAELACRINYKLEFGYLEQTGKHIFFDRAFKTPLTERDTARLDAIPNLTPGDFKTVSQKLYYLGEEVGNAERLSALEEESLQKKESRRVCLGFSAA